MVRCRVPFLLMSAAASATEIVLNSMAAKPIRAGSYREQLKCRVGGCSPRPSPGFGLSLKHSQHQQLVSVIVLELLMVLWSSLGWKQEPSKEACRRPGSLRWVVLRLG